VSLFDPNPKYKKPARKTSKQTPESKVTKAAIAYLEGLGAVVVRTNVGVFRNYYGEGIIHGAPKGTSDWQVCLPTGRFLALEVKAPGGRASTDQLAYGARVQAAGGLFVVCGDVQRDLVPVVEAELRRGGLL
jgi:hypothetical protein